MALRLPPSPHHSNRALLREPQKYFLWLTREYGDVVCYRPAPEPAYLVNHPDDIRYVLVDNNRNYSKATYINQMFKTAVSDGLLTSEGETWKRQRRLMQPSFNKPRLARLDEVITSQTDCMLERWRESADKGLPIYLSKEISRLTLTITTRALFGVNLDEEIGQVGEAVDASGALLERPNNHSFKASLQIVEEIVQRIITNRRQSMGETVEGVDLLGSMMQVQDEDTGLGMSDAELRNQVITLLLAGYDTTASALTWTFFLLSQHPEVVARFRQELSASLGDRIPTYADLPALEYALMIFQESLRLYSPAWVMGRVALGDDTIGGYNVPAGTIIAICPYAVHRHLKFWDDPEQFDPGRFAPERSAGLHNFAFIPFGAGPRKCIGNNFAMLESQLIIARVMQRFDLSLASDPEAKPEIGFVLRPNYGIKMILSALAS